LRDYGVDGQLGLEPTPEEYVANMVDVFRAVWRVLRDDGVLWLNLGSTYASGSRTSYDADAKYAGRGGTFRPGAGRADGVVDERSQRNRDGVPTPPGFKPKDLVPIPWMVAMALQRDGWYLRSDIIWSKPNCMPSSVQDRPTTSHEYLFLLTKRARYYYDAEAVKEPCEVAPHAPGNKTDNGRLTASMGHCEEPKRVWAADGKRNRRSVWTIATEPFSGAHFATFPRKLIEPCILAGTSAKGCCPSCGAPWQRVMEKTDEPDASAKGSRFEAGKTAARDGDDRTQEGERTTTRTVGWRPTCDCDAGDPIPCTVLDPFLGSGTTACVAIEHGRAWVGCELNAEYAKIAEQRIAGAREKLGLFAEVGM